MARSKHPWRMLERNTRIYVKHEYFGYSRQELSDEYHITRQRVIQIIDSVHYRVTHEDTEYVSEVKKILSNQQ